MNLDYEASAYFFEEDQPGIVHDGLSICVEWLMLPKVPMYRS
jgi:hypothetical protein